MRLARRRRVLLWLGLLLLAPGCLAAPDEFADVRLGPTLFTAPETLAKVAAAVATDPAAAAAVRPLVELARAALSVVPDPPRAIVYEGRVGNHPERRATIAKLADLHRLQILLAARAATGEAAFGEAARRILVAWTTAIEPTGNPINMNKLDSLVEAYDRLAGELDPTEREQVATWLRQLAARQQAGPATEQGNWLAKRLKLVGQIGVTLGDGELLDWAEAGYRRYVEANLYADGASYDLRHRDALSYHVGGLTPLLELALAARRAGRDLYRYEAPSGGSLRGSIAFVAPYAEGRLTYPQWRHSRVALDRQRWEAGDEHYRPGRLWEPADGRLMFQLATLLEPTWRPVAEKLAAAAADDPWTGWLSLLATVDATQGD